jgi:transposase InsO family protein
MNTKIASRKEAVRLYWQEGLSKAEISRRLKKSRRWVVRWLARYEHEQGEKSLEDRSSAPKHRKEVYPQRIKKMVLKSRKARKAQNRKYPYALISAQAIYYELRDLGVQPCPPVRTIHFWLKQAGEIDKPAKPCKESNPTYPAPRCQAVNDVHELDLKGPFYLKGSSQKYYLIVLRDVFGKKVALRALKEKEMEQIIDFSVETWQKIGLPKFLQMDNGLEFRGSNAYPRSLSRLMRVCLDVKVQPVFIPKSEPWRNGVIENLNNLIERLLLKAKAFNNEKQLFKEVQKLETCINETHQLPALDGKTPNEFSAKATRCFLSSGYDWRKRNLQKVKGKVTFIRLVRKSGRITVNADDKFFVGKKYKWQYVQAIVNVQKKQLGFYWMGKLIKSVAYS